MMTPHPNFDISTTQKCLDEAEGWDLLFHLYGTAREALAEVGGAEEWIRVLRDQSPEDIRL